MKPFLPFLWRGFECCGKRLVLQKAGEGTGLEQPNNATFRPGSAQGEGKRRGHAHLSNCFRREAAPSPGSRFPRGDGTSDRPHAAGAAHSRGIDSRTHRDLNQINTAWDEKIGLVLSSDAKPEMLEKLVKQAPEEDFYLLRLISEHPRANAKTLNKLAKHPYGAIRENVARHPNADASTLTWLSRDRSQPLWYLVAFNPNTPSVLQRRLRERLKRLGENHNAIR